MSDSNYTREQLLDPNPGDVFTLDHGEIRIDAVTEHQIYYVRWRNGTTFGSPKRMQRDVWREAVDRYLTRNDQPTMTCPRCGWETEDFDGVEFVAHVAPMPNACGYCRHPSRDGDGNGNMVCGICGDKEVDASPNTPIADLIAKSSIGASDKPLTTAQVESALKVGATERAAAERTMKRSPRR